MATTYGYGGEFSSDEDVDRLEQQQQQSDRMVQSKYDNTSRPGKRQIEDMIESIKALPFDQEIQLSDEFLAGLLDYYKTPRGPIVDSTRKLYHKIALRLIRGEQQQYADDNAKETNGNSNNIVHSSSNNNNNNNNNSISITHKAAPQQSADTYSSDDDDEPVVVLSKRNFDSRVVSNENDENKMDVDLETPTGLVRETKQVDLSTTDDDSDSSDESSESQKSDSESDVMDATPIKAPAHQTPTDSREKEGFEALMAAQLLTVTPKQPGSSIKRQPLAQSTPKETTETAKKPYTRSQRVATRSATRGTKATEISTKSTSKASTSAEVFIENKRASSKKYVLLAVTLFILVLAFLLYYFRSSISNSAAPLLGKKIMF